MEISPFAGKPADPSLLIKDQQHLGAIVDEAQRIVKDALESVDSSCPGGRRVDER
jgi:hypothetical protein